MLKSLKILKLQIKIFKLSKQDLKKAYQSLYLKDKEALKLAYQRIYYYHLNKKKASYSYKDQLDTKFYIQWNPIDNVGLICARGNGILSLNSFDDFYSCKNSKSSKCDDVRSI